MKRKDLENLWFLLKAVYRQEKKTFYIGIAHAVLEAVTPYILVLLIGLITDAALAGFDMRRVMGMILAAVGGKLILGVITARLGESFRKKLENYPKEFGSRELNRKALTMDYEYLEDAHAQDIRFRAFQNSFYGVGGWLMVQLCDLLQNLVTIGAAAAIVFPMFGIAKNAGYRFWGSGWSALLLAAALGGLLFVNYKFSFRDTQKATRHFLDASAIYNKKLFYLDLLSGVEPQKDIRAMGLEGMLNRDIDGLFAGICGSEKSRNAIYVRRTVLQRIILNLCNLLIYAYAGMQAWLGIITIGSVVAYASSMELFAGAVARLAVTMGHLKTAALYAADYREFTGLGRRKYEGTIPVEKRQDDRFSVAFENVSFRYPGSDEYVIRNLNLKLEIGEKLAIVGRNGSGKTTFVKLLCRLYDVTEGCIKVNGIDIRKYDYREYCNLFSVVFQDFQMFAFPVGENIAAGAEMDEGRVAVAMERAGLGARLSNLPGGLGTCVGKDYDESGVAFSGGERQKLAIARAIYKDAPFVIMDEPTAALDPKAETEVFEGFDGMVGHKTAIYISHRLASCRFCEDILVFDRGNVVQHGTHEELEKQEGLYRELWNAQAQYYA